MNREKFLGGSILLLCIISVILGLYLILLQKGEMADSSNFPSALLLEKKGVAVVNIYGAIQGQDQSVWSKMDSAEQILDNLKRISKDPKIGAVIIRINSPGGTVAAVQEIYEGVLKLKQVGKKVVVSIGDIAASGGYYIACAADKIVANSGSLTGSIGVIISIPNIKGLLDKFGVTCNTIKSSTHKDIGSMYRKMTDEEQGLLQGVVDSAYHQFLQVVSINRKAIKREQLSTIADGRIFTGSQAKQVGLIDELGTYEDAIKIAAKLAGIEGEPEIIKDEEPLKRLFEMIKGQHSSFESLANRTETALLEYRYEPGIF